jgi:hypothetical protein
MKTPQDRRSDEREPTEIDRGGLTAHRWENSAGSRPASSLEIEAIFMKFPGWD